MSSSPKKWHLNRLFFSVFILVLLGSSIFYAGRSLQKELLNEAIQKSLKQVYLLKNIADASNVEVRELLVKAARTNNERLSVLSAEGKLISDSQLPAAEIGKIDNHSDRLELMLAKEKGEGVAVRNSNTINIINSQTIYAAVKLADNSYLRVAVPFVGVQAQIDTHLLRIIYLVGIVFFLSAMFFILRNRQLQLDLKEISQVVKAISRGEYRRSVNHLGRAEFIPLAKAVNILAHDINSSIQMVNDKNIQLKTILESLEEGVLILGANGAIRAHNKSMAQMFPGLVNGKDKQPIEAISLPLLQRCIEQFIKEKKLPHKSLRFENEQKRQLLISLYEPVQPVLDLSLIIIVHDITSVLSLERVHKDFVANVSHELRTPLTSIKGYAETMINSECDAAQVKHFAQKIYKHSNLLSNIIEDLLILARVDDEFKVIEQTVVDPFECAQLAEQLLTHKAEETQVEVVFEELDKVKVMANKDLLAQAVRNLLENAYRYAPSKSEITVRVQAVNNEAVISISDNGLGIEAAEQQRLFERFYRVEKQRDSQTTGLGLAITKQIIERFHGRIWLQSPSANAKTTFFIALPLA